MRIPRRPPNIERIWQSLRPEQLAAVVPGQARSQPTDEYRHWDELRHRQPPQDLSHETWWLKLKLARRLYMTPIPLVDDRGIPFGFNVTPQAHAMLHDLTQRASGTIGITDQVTNPQTRNRYLIRNLMEEGIRSSQIEGASTTRAIAKEMLRSSRPPRDASEQMILNNYVAMQHIIDLGRDPLTPERVFELHRLLTEKTLKDSRAAGRFRRPDENVDVVDPRDNEVLHVPPPADQLPDRLRRMCDFANEKIPDGFVHPVIRSILLHFWLAYDHPFVDGNGRCARALFYWSMLRQKYWLFQFISISEIIHRAPAKYARAFLFTETDDNDATYFVLHQLDVLRKAVDELNEYINTSVAQRGLIESRLRAATELNDRQVNLLVHALKYPHARYDIEQHRVTEGVVYQTARSDLLKLVGAGLFTKRKSGRRWQFIPVSDLEERLRKL